MRLGHSLRGRLTGSLGLILCTGLAAVAALHELEQDHGFGGRIGRLLLGDELPEPWQDLAVLLPFGALILLLVEGVCRWSLRPLLRASAEAARIGPRDPDNRINTAGLPDELFPLVTAMNAALDRLATAYQVERSFTSNAAHELRTPLATLSLRLQRIRHDEAPIDWPALDGDIATMSGLIDRLLDLARKQDAGTSAIADATPLNLCRVVREAAAQMVPLVEAAGRELVVELPDHLAVRGDAGDLQDMARNLIENALKHGAGRIDLQGRSVAGPHGSDAQLDVADEGAGVAPELRHDMFERFRKGRQAEAGSGLGLAIVQEVVRRHGGTVGFVPGARCVVRVALPGASSGPGR